MKSDDEIMQEVTAALQTEGITTDVESTVRELSDFEKTQQAKGWNPDGEKSAEEWARSEPLYEEIKTRGKEIKQLKRTVDELKEFLQKQEKIAYDKAMADLMAQREAAIRSGDVNLVNQIDEEKSKTQYTAPATKPDVVLEFEERHASWLQGTSFDELEIRTWALQRDQELSKLNMTPEKHLQTLEEHLHKKFPTYFNQGTAETITNPVESGYTTMATKPTTTNRKKATFNDLTPEQKQVARDFERMGVMKVDEYIEQLYTIGELK